MTDPIFLFNLSLRKSIRRMISNTPAYLYYLYKGLDVAQDSRRRPEHVVDIQLDRDDPQACVADAARLR